MGSPLGNIAEIEWLTSLTETESLNLLGHRATLEEVEITEEEKSFLLEWSGKHPFLLQQLLNSFFDEAKTGHRENRFERLIKEDTIKNLFASWWNPENNPGGFHESERSIYKKLCEEKEGTEEYLAASLANLSIAECEESLGVLNGTGVVHKVSIDQYRIGSLLFQKWVERQK